MENREYDFVENRFVINNNQEGLEKLLPEGVAGLYMDRLNEWLIIIDKQLKIVYANRKARETLFYGCVGKNIFDVFHRNENNSVIFRVMNSGNPVLNHVQTYYISPEGSLKASLASTYPVIQGNEVVGVIEMGEDITGYNNMSEQILHNLIMEMKSYEKDLPSKKKREHYSLDSIVGESMAVRQVKDDITRAANSKSNVLIYGETGTGKELVAQSLYSLAYEGMAPFIAQNCAAIPESLLESMLFGTVKGAYTGSETREGLFELADGGILFLDEINSMPMALQAKILRVLEEKKLRRIGAVKETHVDFRLVAAMNAEPFLLVNEGKLRSDLYYRLNVLRINVPPLRERKEDIPLLAGHFIALHNQEGYGEIKDISEEALKILMSYSWPGNIRELRNVMERSFYHCDGPRVEKAHIKIEEAGSLLPLPEKNKAPEIVKLREVLEKTEKHVILMALDRNNGNISKTARELDIPQQTLDSKIKKLGLREVIQKRYR